MKLAVLCDFREEQWPSMDLVADELVTQGSPSPDVTLEAVRPPVPAWVGRVLAARGTSLAERWRRNAGLAALRYGYYPLQLRLASSRFDGFHIADHSYAHLALSLPVGRVGVFCHDLDTFRPELEKRGGVLARALARRARAGLERASVVFYSTPAVRTEILEHALVPASRLVHAPYGVAREFQPEPRAEDAAVRDRRPYLLHVGSLIERKNPAFLLRLFGALKERFADLTLIQIGGTWGRDERSVLESARFGASVIQLRDLSRLELSAYYRGAAAVVLPSVREGFGLPVIEALATGAPVVASDLDVLRQVGQDAVTYAGVNDLGAWCGAVDAALSGGGTPLDRRLEVAARYSWRQHAATIVAAYASVFSG